MKILNSNKTDLFCNWTRDKVNDLTVKVAKSILGVIASLTETGLYPLSIDVLCNSVKYCVRSIALNNNCTHERLQGLAVTANIIKYVHTKLLVHRRLENTIHRGDASAESTTYYPSTNKEIC
jgi:hypothetical protein